MSATKTHDVCTVDVTAVSGADMDAALVAAGKVYAEHARLDLEPSGVDDSIYRVVAIGGRIPSAKRRAETAAYLLGYCDAARASIWFGVS